MGNKNSFQLSVETLEKILGDSFSVANALNALQNRRNYSNGKVILKPVGVQPETISGKYLMRWNAQGEKEFILDAKGGLIPLTIAKTIERFNLFPCKA